MDEQRTIPGRRCKCSRSKGRQRTPSRAEARVAGSLQRVIAAFRPGTPGPSSYGVIADVAGKAGL
jgi:hypothetical protein